MTGVMRCLDAVGGFCIHRRDSAGEQPQRRFRFLLVTDGSMPVKPWLASVFRLFGSSVGIAATSQNFTVQFSFPSGRSRLESLQEGWPKSVLPHVTDPCP